MNPKDPSYKNYGAKGIRFYITFQDVGKLYYRDNANKMKKPSIDRVDSNGNYCFGNCRFIELSENIRLANTGRKHSEETNRKRNKTLSGRKFTKEWREKISKANKGRKLSKEHCENISKGRMGIEPWNKGKRKAIKNMGEKK